MELHTINQNEAGIRLGMADYYNGYKMSIPNTSMKIAGESIEDLHISDRIPHILRGTYLTVSNADVTRPCEIIGLQGGSATGTNEIKVDILPIQIADTTRDGLSITRDDRDITINGKCEPTGTIKTGTTVTHSNATDWARLNSFTNSNVSSTVEGTFFTLTDASSTKQASITELKGNTTQEGTPTPSSPVEVKTVSGDNEVVVSNEQHVTGNSYRVDLGGKNLVANNIETQEINGLTITKNTDGSLLINGTTNATTRINLMENLYMPVGNYVWSTNATGTVSNNCYMSLLTMGTTTEISGTSINMKRATIKTFSISTSANTYARFYVSSGITFTNFKIYPQLEKRKYNNTIQSIRCKPYRAMQNRRISRQY